MGVQNDPIAGNEGVAATAATIINAGAASKRVIWQGIGHGASIYRRARCRRSSATSTAASPVDGHVLPRLRPARRSSVYGALRDGC